MARSDAEWVQDIVTAIADIRPDTLDLNFAAFTVRPPIVRSVLYSIAVYGRCREKISPAFEAAYPDIPWRAIASIRDQFVHEYFLTDTRRIWDFVVNDLDELANALSNPSLGPPAAD